VPAGIATRLGAPDHAALEPAPREPVERRAVVVGPLVGALGRAVDAPRLLTVGRAQQPATARARARGHEAQPLVELVALGRRDAELVRRRAVTVAVVLVLLF